MPPGLHAVEVSMKNSVLEIVHIRTCDVIFRRVYHTSKLSDC